VDRPAASLRPASSAEALDGSVSRPEPYGLLLAVVLATLAVQGTVASGTTQQVLTSVLLGASLVLAFRVGHVSQRWLALAAAVAAGSVTLSVLRAATGAIGDGEARLINALVVAFGPPAVALGVVRNLRTSGRVRLEAVLGVLSLYILLGLMFAFVFGALDRLAGEPFFEDGASATTARCVYFSFVTLATVGYGDLTARSDLGHTLSVFEALTGQIYLVTVVSLIVSNLGRERSAPAEP
jgi:hypothetical protein